MNAIRSGRVSWLAAALVLAAAAGPRALSAQAAAGWALIPLVGFGVVLVDESRNFGGLEAGVELEYGADDWRLGGLASWKGVGVGCSEACFEGGPALAVGVSGPVGPLWFGAGFGALRQRGVWSALPFGRVSWYLSGLRVELRVERPRAREAGTYVPLLIGFPTTGGAGR